ncbi:MAG: tetratricopeptide repeat protein [Planctomycetes bacterium]|nr:tetratricopeptide repeat protein [Planctomycetota bacterium]
MTRIALVGFVGALLLLQGCSAWSSENTTGVLVGAGAGAGIGALAASGGSVAWGAVIGVGAGAVAGYFIAEWLKEPEPAPGNQISAEERARSDAEAYFRQAQIARHAADSEYYLKRSIELSPTPAAYNNLGLLYLQHGDKTRARNQWLQAVELDPANRPALENLKRLG